ncbi:MAG: hypothetical protein AB9873_10980 [Syntrophobacteraceae bacterium]
MSTRISQEESFEQSWHNCLQWLEVMAMEPVELCSTWGNYNVAWELVADLNSDGSDVVTMECSYLSEEQKHGIRRFLEGLLGTPRALLVSATSVEANQKAMSDPAWLPHKRAASELLKVLESAAARNKSYFSGT